MFNGILGVLKAFPKNFTNFTGKRLYRIKCEPKSYAFYDRETKYDISFDCIIFFVF